MSDRFDVEVNNDSLHLNLEKSDKLDEMADDDHMFKGTDSA